MRLARYRRRDKGRWTTLVYDADRHPDPRTSLSQLLGKAIPHFVDLGPIGSTDPDSDAVKPEPTFPADKFPDIGADE